MHSWGICEHEHIYYVLLYDKFAVKINTEKQFDTTCFINCNSDEFSEPRYADVKVVTLGSTLTLT